MKKTYNIVLLVSIITLAIVASASTVMKASALAHPYYTVTPSETIMGPSPSINQTFTVTIKLYNATHANVPAGITGVEVHLRWNKTLIEPVSFVDEVGKPGGVLAGQTILYGISPGFFNSSGIKIATQPYTNATEYAEAGASSTGPWWGDNGTVAEITFKVVSQPQPSATCPIEFDFTDLVDATPSEVSHGVVNATYTILSPVTETVTFEGVNYQVTISSDSVVTAPENLGFQNNTSGGAMLTFNVTSGGYCNVTVPNNFMYSVPVENWTVTVDGSTLTTPNKAITTDSTNTYIWFNFTSDSHVIALTSTKVVPEFATPSLILILMTTTLIVATVATSLRKRKLHC